MPWWWKEGEEEQETSSTLLTPRLKQLADSVHRQAREAHGAFVLLRHNSKHGLELASEQFVGSGGTSLRVEVWAAADLRLPRFSDITSYCALAIGPAGKPWAAKVARGQQVKTHVALHQRHPRWGAVCTLPLTLPGKAGAPRGADAGYPKPPAANEPLELSVRVMNSNALRSDKLLGEARIPLVGKASGASTVRLLGGGFASISLRWYTLDSGGSDQSTTANAETASPANGSATNGAHGECGASSSAAPAGSRASVPAAGAPRRRRLTGELPVAPSGAHVVALDSDEVESEEGESMPDWAIDKEYAAFEKVGDAKAEHASAASSSAAQPKPSGDPFEDALAFWTSHAPGTGGQPSSPSSTRNVARSARAFTALLQSMGPNNGCSADEVSAVINELVLQAPLTHILSGGAELVGLVLDAMRSRLAVLTPLSRSRVVGALVERLNSQGLDAPTEREQDLLCELILETRGDGLVELKRLVDTAGTDHDLRHTVFQSVSSTPSRAKLLEHFRVEAKQLVHRPLHVLSDIDMTIWVGQFGTGGPKFPQGPIPGSLALFKALRGRITFLSARPPVWQEQTRRMLFDDIGISEATVLPGTLAAVLQTLFQPEKAHKAMGEQKNEAFQQFAGLHPEARFVFVGDSGEGDVDFACAFMQAPGPGMQANGVPRERRDRVALIHDVVDSEGVRPRSGSSRRAELRLGGVIVFDTYAGAAVELFRLGFLDAVGLRAAASSCMDEFAEIQQEEFASHEVFETRRTELFRDLRAVNQALREEDPGAGLASAAVPSSWKVADASASNGEAAASTSPREPAAEAGEQGTATVVEEVDTGSASAATGPDAASIDSRPNVAEQTSDAAAPESKPDAAPSERGADE